MIGKQDQGRSRSKITNQLHKQLMQVLGSLLKTATNIVLVWNICRHTGKKNDSNSNVCTYFSCLCLWFVVLESFFCYLYTSKFQVTNPTTPTKKRLKIKEKRTNRVSEYVNVLLYMYSTLAKMHVRGQLSVLLILQFFTHR